MPDQTPPSRGWERLVERFWEEFYKLDATRERMLLRLAFLRLLESHESMLAQQAAQIAALSTEVERLKEQEAHIRGQLWMNHQRHVAARYGDDGEMQCNAPHRNGETHAIGSIDFKREELPRLTSAICSMLRFEARRAEQAEAEIERLKERIAKGEKHEKEAWLQLEESRAEVERLTQENKELREWRAEIEAITEPWQAVHHLDAHQCVFGRFHPVDEVAMARHAERARYVAELQQLRQQGAETTRCAVTLGLLRCLGDSGHDGLHRVYNPATGKVQAFRQQGAEHK